MYNRKEALNRKKQHDSSCCLGLDKVKGFQRDAIFLAFMRSFVRAGNCNRKRGIYGYRRHMNLLTISRPFTDIQGHFQQERRIELIFKLYNYSQFFSDFFF